ncbi:EamA family transporter [Pseudomonas gingeri]|uniref:EamA family transporter n=1 Tax=Pseudomonas gingeri TaxID=117681 RepID=UPI0015A0DAC5|nr:EamA family transporter [Pseudomonas gingeri]NWA02779.1 EamA family transporter [Pseudomonas gingeri]NWA18260.1 EamA family transporter [Pseudomonas gingeri]NWA58950.1 EamA family transporter [Pseudomonas gingeri]NWA99529.1 EamA family transporter [Pseudomonas gingeri]NWB05534.1 EamA family transporter [Pseudomonas gingeri]
MQENAAVLPVTATARPPRRALLLAASLCVLSMCLVQFGAALSSPTMDTYGSLSTTWLRLCWAATLLMLVVRPPLHTYSLSRWGAAAGLGLAMAVMTSCFFASIQRIPLGLAIAIEFLGPLLLASLAIRRWRALIWPLLAMAGVLLLARNEQGWIGEPLGLALAFGSAAGWGAYILLMKRVGTLFPGFEGLSVSLLAAAVLTAPLGLWQSGGHLPWLQVASCAGLALFVPLLPYGLEMIALRRMPASSFGILMSVEPAVGALAGYMVLNQPMVPLQFAGTALVVSASLGVLMVP